MKLKLNIEYRTQVGEDLRVSIRQKDATWIEYNMLSSDNEVWKADVNIKAPATGCVEYFYSVHRQQTELRREWQMLTHRVDVQTDSFDTYICNDVWYDMPEDSFLYSSAFTECVNRHDKTTPERGTFRKMLRLKVRAPQLRKGESLRLVGNDPYLGAWDLCRSTVMYEHAENEWVATLDASELRLGVIEFKFIIVNKDKKTDVIWEEGGNRSINVPLINEQEVHIFELTPATFAIYSQHFAGTAVPLFSLRSEGSFGVGDFGDLKMMVDWVHNTGQKVLQLLPINDTTLNHTWTDSYPYSCVSIYALHPMYCDLRQLPALHDIETRKAFAQKRAQLNELQQIDYEAVNNAKNEYLRLVFAQEGKDILSSGDFKTWFAEEQQWLVPYAQYSVLRDTYGTCDYTKWPDHNQWNEEDRKALTNSRTKIYREASFYYFVQFILATQMREAHEYARNKNVVLKGDIPIGVNRYGSDSWMEPRYFNMNGQAGAPPDDFSAEGQNWGFPTYNWEEMLKDDCQWWVRRFSNMAKYFDAYRIDHVLGFFRIWEVPMPYSIGLMGQFQPALGLTSEEIEAYGLQWDEERLVQPYGGYDWDCLFLRDHNDKNKFHPRIASQLSQVFDILEPWEKDCYNRLYDDYFYRRNNHFWYLEAMKKLPRLINATRMLVCAEDLGMVPDCVADVMNELRILSLEIQSMPKEPGLRFGKLHHNPYRSVCTISSHDTPTLRMWWDEDRERTQDYYRTRLRRGDAAPHPLPGWLARDIIYRHLSSPSMLCIITLQDWLAMDEHLRLADAGAERINIPANPKHYWRYRMHLTLEQLLANNDFCYSVKALVEETHR